MSKKRWLALGLSALAVLLFWGIKIAALPDPLFPPDYSKLVLAEDGQILRVFLNKKEQWILPDGGEEIPEKLKEAVIHYEDKRFEKHWGIDPFALLRALFQNITTGARISGASTITMQVARLMEPKPRTVLNKLLEMAQAVLMEIKYSKGEILKHYLRHAPYGGNIQGYRTASLRYFGREPEELSWAQAATLAVLPNNPANVNPMRNRDELKKKRDGLLFGLWEKGVLEQASYELACEEPLPRGQLPFPFAAPHLAERLALTSPVDLIKTTINLEIQKRAEMMVKNYVSELASRGINNAAVLITDTKSGEVKAYVASQDYFDDLHQGKIDGVRMKRSTGSTLKPFLFGLAMDQGLIVRESVLLDIPTSYGGYVPYNADLKFNGLVRADQALIRSLNVTAVGLLQEYGVERFWEFLKSAGLRQLQGSAQEHGLSLILGSAAASLWELSVLYRGLGNYGSFGELKVLPAEEGQAERLISEGSSFLILESLKEVERPQAEYFWRRYQSSALLAWKTGTSFGGRDAWAVGVCPQWTVAVWAGNFKGGEVKDLSGLETAAPLLFQLFAALEKGDGLSWFRSPSDDLILVEVSSRTGYRVKGEEGETRQVLASASAQPLRYSPYEKTVFLNREETLQVCSLCWSRGDVKEVFRLVYPPEVNSYLRDQGLEYALPPHNPHCPGLLQAENPISFIYPQQGSGIIVPRDKKGEYQKIRLEVAHNFRDSRLFWYLDHSYLGITTEKHELSVLLKEGDHNLTVVDSLGNQKSLNFSSR